MKRKRIFLILTIIICAILLCFTLVFCIRRISENKAFAEHPGKAAESQLVMHILNTTTYENVFLSMYSINNFASTDFSAIKGISIFQPNHILSDFEEVLQAFDSVFSSGNTIDYFYFGVEPSLLVYPENGDVEDFLSYMDAYPETTFELILPFPSSEYWQSLTEEQYSEAFSLYEDFITLIEGRENTHLYYVGGENWLINNPANYITPSATCLSASRQVIISVFLGETYQISLANMEERLGQAQELISAARNNPPSYPDLNGWSIVFLGDSIFGNYTGSLSVPRVVSGLSGATVYNCGYGGCSAAVTEAFDSSFTEVTYALISGDLSQLPSDNQVYRGISAYRAALPATEKLCFVINYGLNDYFRQLPVSSEDSYDITTYCGALRSAIADIRGAYADAQIVLCTPTYTAWTPTENNPTEGKSLLLQDYVDAIFDLSEELNVTLVDNYYSLGINADNHTEYLPDLVHPNEQGRFMIAQNIIRAIGK